MRLFFTCRCHTVTEQVAVWAKASSSLTVQSTSRNSHVEWFRAVQVRSLRTSPHGLETGKVKLIPTVHVDDIIVAGNNKDCKWLKHVFCLLMWYTGCAFERNTDGSSIKIIPAALFIDKLYERLRTEEVSPVPVCGSNGGLAIPTSCCSSGVASNHVQTRHNERSA